MNGMSISVKNSFLIGIITVLAGSITVFIIDSVDANIQGKVKRVVQEELRESVISKIESLSKRIEEMNSRTEYILRRFERSDSTLKSHLREKEKERIIDQKVILEIRDLLREMKKKGGEDGKAESK